MLMFRCEQSYAGTPSCSPGEELQEGACIPIVCDEGEALDGGACVEISCEAGQVLNGSTCEDCPVGQQEVDGSCEDITCEAGQVLNGSTCEDCPAGQQKVDGSCEDITCGVGEELEGSKCVPVSSVPTCDEWIDDKAYSGQLLAVFAWSFSETIVISQSSCATWCANWDGNVPCSAVVLAEGDTRCRLFAWNSEEAQDSPGDSTYALCSSYIDCPVGEVVEGTSCVPKVCPVGFLLDGDDCIAIQCPVGEEVEGYECVRIDCPTGQVLNGDDCIDWVPELPDDFEPIDCENFAGPTEAALTHPEVDAPPDGFCSDPYVTGAIEYNNQERAAEDQYTGPELPYKDYDWCTPGQSTGCVNNPSGPAGPVTCNEELSRMAFWWSKQRCMCVPYLPLLNSGAPLLHDAGNIIMGRLDMIL